MKLVERIQKSEVFINEKMKNNNVVVRILEDKDEDKGEILIFKDKKIERIFQIERIAYRQIEIKEDNKVLEYSLHIENLGKWLYNLYNPIEVLYVFYGGEQRGRTLTKNQVEKIAIGRTDSMVISRKNNMDLEKKVTDKQPIVKGYLGPMFERIDYGKIYLRYETQEIHDMLSA